MTTLVEILDDPTRRAAVVRDGVALLESEVARKRGMRGMAIKGGFKTVKKLKPGILGHALDQLLPEFAPAVDPHLAKAREAGDIPRYFDQHRQEIAESLLAVTDRRATRAKNKVMLKVYRSLRSQALHHTAEAVPGLGRLVDTHVRAAEAG